MEEAYGGGERLKHDEALRLPTDRAVTVQTLLQHLDIAHGVDLAPGDREHELGGRCLEAVVATLRVHRDVGVDEQAHGSIAP